MLLDSWILKLCIYVLIKVYCDVVYVILKYGVVLLFGNLLSGKLVIGVIVLMIVLENVDNIVFVLISLCDFEVGWNFNDFGCFFWIDDVFGLNVLCDDYV